MCYMHIKYKVIVLILCYWGFHEKGTLSYLCAKFWKKLWVQMTCTMPIEYISTIWLYQLKISQLETLKLLEVLVNFLTKLNKVLKMHLHHRYYKNYNYKWVQMTCTMPIEYISTIWLYQLKRVLHIVIIWMRDSGS